MLDFIGEFTILDLVVLVSLAGGVLVGFQQGALRYILNASWSWSRSSWPAS